MAASRRKLIVVSNRGPVSYAHDGDGTVVARRGGGGLVTALRSLLSHHDVTWIACAMSEADRERAAAAGGESFAETARDGAPYRLRLVAVDADAYDRYYNVVANPTLWFIQHALWDLGREPSLGPEFHRAWSEGYAAVNEAFADAVVAELEHDPGQAVFFHDYHLYLAPGLVRERVPGVLTAHFVHIPWPQSDGWTVLPAELRRAVHEGLLANDVVGFHTDRWRRNFLRSCEDLLGLETCGGDTVAHAGRRTHVSARPISVDPAEFAELAASEAVLAEERRIVEGRPEQLVLRVDRTDPSKNVVRGFQAFGLLLEQHPELHGRVGVLALLDPSRQDIPQYAEYLASIEREVRAVNDRFGRPGWLPIDLQVADNFPQSVAAYKQFDVLLVNAVFDGLNLVSKEAPLVNVHDGVVVLSENAGAHEEIGGWALSVNPFDIQGQAAALHEALQLSRGERRRRAEGIRAHVREHDIAAWIEGQLADLDRAGASARG